MRKLFLAPTCIIATLMLMSSASALTKEQAKAICAENPFINSNFMMLACVNQEIDSASRVERIVESGGSAARQAQETCRSNPFINSNFMMLACIQQEISAGKALKN